MQITKKTNIIVIQFVHGMTGIERGRCDNGKLSSISFDIQYWPSEDNIQYWFLEGLISLRRFTFDVVPCPNF